MQESGSTNREALTELTLASAAQELARRDKLLGSIYEKLGPPPLWARQPGFPTLVKIILEQQVSLSSAAAIYGRLKRNTVPFRPERMLQLGEAHLKSLGLTRQKTAYCLHLAQSLTDKRLRLAQLSRMSDHEATAALLALKGIGPWSANIYLLMALGRPDIWPTNDLALAIAITELRRLTTRPNANELAEIAEAWRPYRSVAARMLWQYYLARRGAYGK